MFNGNNETNRYTADSNEMATPSQSHDEENCLCGLSDLVLDSLIISHGCTDQEADEILSDLLSKHKTAVELQTAATVAVDVFDSLIGEPIGVNITALKLEKEGTRVHVDLDSDDFDEWDSGKNAVPQNQEYAELDSGEPTDTAQTEDECLLEQCPMSEFLTIASDFVIALQMLIKDSSHAYHDFLGNIEAGRQSRGERWICSTHFDPETPRFAIEIRPAKPTDEDCGDLEEILNA